MEKTVIIGADIVPTQSNSIMFEEGNIEELIGNELLEVLRTSDFSIFNLEVPLTTNENIIKKCGPNIKASENTIQGLKMLNPYFFTLANNHIMDYGVEGLESTIRCLSNTQVAYAGVGKNLREASKPYILHLEERSLGIYCCVEREFSGATLTSAGANVFDPLVSLEEIRNLKLQCDYVIVLYHGGKEEYRYPAPYLQKVCRKIVDCGADLVVCQHSHCIGCQERWNDGTIIYGQGNFIFDASDDETWQTGLLLRIVFGESVRLEYVPVRKHGNKVRIADESDAKEILKKYWERSEEILIEGLVEKNYRNLAENCLWNYIQNINGRGVRGIPFRIINKLSGYRFAKWYLQKKYTEEVRLALLNYLMCDAHADLLITALEQDVSK